MAKKKVDAKYAAECRKFLAEVSSQPDVREVSQGVLMKYIEQGTGERQCWVWYMQQASCC